MSEDRSQSKPADEARPERETRTSPLNVATFDGVRGFVVLSIVLIHCSGSTGWYPSAEFPLALRRSGSVSVALLFSISGFVLFLPVAARGTLGDWRSFAIRRAGRILPGYYLSVALSLLFTIGIGRRLAVQGFRVGHVTPGAVAAHLGFLQQELYPTIVGFAINPILWTMSLIVLFYALLPLIANRYLKHPILGLVLAITACSIWRTLTKNDLRIFLQFPAYMTALALGMSAAVAYVWLHRHVGKERLRPYAPLVFACAAAALVAVLYLNGRGYLRGEHGVFADPVPYSIASPALFLTLVISSAFASKWLQWPFANPVSRWLGNVSYGVFLFHALAAQLLLQADPGIFHEGSFGAMLYMSSIVVTFALIVAWLHLELLEGPLRARARRLARRYEQSPNPQPTAPQPAAVLAE